MRCFRFILFFLCIGITAHAQQSAEIAGLFEKAAALVESHPQQSIKIGAHLLTNTTKNTDKAAANFLMADSYFSMGNYTTALEYAFESKFFAAAANHPEGQLKSDLLISKILRLLKLDIQSEAYLSEAKTLSTTVSAELQHFMLGKILHEQALFELGKRHPKKALQLLEKAQLECEKYNKPESVILSNQLAATSGKIDAALGNCESAAAVFKQSLQFYKSHDNKLGQTQVLYEQSKMYFQQKQHLSAIESLSKAIRLAEILQNDFLLADINKQFALNYLALNDRKKYHIYNQKFVALADNTETLENEATNAAFNLISKEQENHTLEREKKYELLFYVSVGIFCFVLLSGILLFFKNQSRQKRYAEIAAYLRNSNSEIAEIAKKEAPKNLTIPAETEQALLLKLKKFEASTKFTNRDMSLAFLSAQFETNTKYLSEIINRHRHDNFNTYINKLRIAYIIEKMKSDAAYLNYKISYLAEESGFSSHSSFATIFKSITGIAPTTFIEFLKKEAKSKNDSQNVG